MMKDKLLLPLLLLLKIKLKALTPILVAMVGMKALKALILSKIRSACPQIVQLCLCLTNFTENYLKLSTIFLLSHCYLY